MTVDKQNQNESSIQMAAFTETPEKTLPQHLDVDVYNALNLQNEQLGEQYEKAGYNPFEKGFKLTEEYVEEILEKKRNQTPVFTEPFLELGSKKITSHFKNAIKNSAILQSKLESLISSNDYDAATIEQFKKAILFLKNRSELLKLNISKLKYKNANALQMYLEMYGLDKELSELLKDLYNPTFDTNMILMQFIQISKERAMIEQQKLKDKEKDLDGKRRRSRGFDKTAVDGLEIIVEPVTEAIETIVDIAHAIAPDVIPSSQEIKEVIDNVVPEVVEPQQQNYSQPVVEEIRDIEPEVSQEQEDTSSAGGPEAEV